MRQRKGRTRGKPPKVNRAKRKPPPLKRNRAPLLRTSQRPTFKPARSDMFFEEVRSFVREYKREFGMCTDCEEDYPPYILEFDHLDPTTKRFNIGDASSVPSLEALQEEIDKCDLVCSNCHKEREHQRREAVAGRA